MHANYSKLLDYYDSANFFADAATYLMYQLAFEKYGEASRYILTVRTDSRTWFESLKRHSLYAHPIKNKHRRMFGRFYPHGFDDEHMRYYERHNAEAVKFFSDRKVSHLLLTLRIDEPEAVAKLSRFLGIDFEVNEFPRENVSSRNKPGFSNHLKRNYNTIIQFLYGNIAPRLSTRSPKQALPIKPPIRSG